MRYVWWFLIALGVSLPVAADRIKDLVSIQGVRTNQLVGYGLVVGLDGTGDNNTFTDQTFRNMLDQFGITMPPGQNLRTRNVAAVAVNADLPAFARPGQQIDITVSSLGNSRSLRGGTLLMTALKGADGRTYAVAQGNLVVGGLGVEGADGSSLTVNVPSVGRIPGGASVERTVESGLHQGDHITLLLHNPDFTTARLMAEEISDLLGPGTAQALDAAAVRVVAPRDPSQRVSFISVIENIEVEPAQQTARVIVNSRTGTIVMGGNVRISPVAITHGSMTVTINNQLQVNQPGAFADGETVVVPETEIAVDQEDSRMFLFGPTVTLDDVVRAVNQIGATPADLMAILEAIKAAGALRAELIVI